MKLSYRKAHPFEKQFYCPYCKKEITYVFNKKILIGIGLDRWTYCSECQRYFRLGIGGFREYSLEIKKEKN